MVNPTNSNSIQESIIIPERNTNSSNPKKPSKASEIAKKILMQIYQRSKETGGCFPNRNPNVLHTPETCSSEPLEINEKPHKRADEIELKEGLKGEDSIFKALDEVEKEMKKAFENMTEKEKKEEMKKRKELAKEFVVTENTYTVLDKDLKKLLKEFTENPVDETLLKLTRTLGIKGLTISNSIDESKLGRNFVKDVLKELRKELKNSEEFKKSKSPLVNEVLEALKKK